MNWDVFTQLSTVQVQLHWVTAVLAFGFGIVVLALRKGTSTHKILGRAFVVMMVVTAVSAFFVRGYGNSQPLQWFSGFSFIHLFIPYTLIGLYRSIRAIRRGDVVAHKRGMIGVFLGALLIAGAFTFLPGRHMHSFFFGDADTIQQSIESGYKK